MNTFETERFKQIVTLIGIIALGLFLVIALDSFIPAFLGAIIFYIICFPLMNYLNVKKNINKGLSITIIFLLSFVVILVPIFTVANILVTKVTQLPKSIQKHGMRR